MGYREALKEEMLVLAWEKSLVVESGFMVWTASLQQITAFSRSTRLHRSYEPSQQVPIGHLRAATTSELKPFNSRPNNENDNKNEGGGKGNKNAAAWVSCRSVSPHLVSHDLPLLPGNPPPPSKPLCHIDKGNRERTAVMAG